MCCISLLQVYIFPRLTQLSGVDSQHLVFKGFFQNYLTMKMSVVDRYHAKSKSFQKGHSAKQRKALELVVEEKCPIAQRDVYDTVR